MQEECNPLRAAQDRLNAKNQWGKEDFDDILFINQPVRYERLSPDIQNRFYLVKFPNDDSCVILSDTEVHVYQLVTWDGYWKPPSL